MSQQQINFDHNFLGIKNINQLKSKLTGSSVAKIITDSKIKPMPSQPSPRSKNISAESRSSYYGQKYNLFDSKKNAPNRNHKFGRQLLGDNRGWKY